MKYKICLILLILTFNIIPVYANSDINSNIIVKENNINEVILQNNEEDTFNSSSLSKFLTALVLMDKMGGKLSQSVIIKDEVSLLNSNEKTPYLFENQKLTYTDLLFALLLSDSSNVERVLAYHLGNNGSSESVDEAIDNFNEMISEKVEELELTDTDFVDIQSNNNKTSVKDLFTISNELFSNNTISNVLKASEYKLKDAEEEEVIIKNINPLVKENSISSVKSDTDSEIIEDENLDKDEVDKSNLEIIDNITSSIATNSFISFIADLDDAEVSGTIYSDSFDENLTNINDLLEDINTNYAFKYWTDEGGIYDTYELANVHFADNRLTLKAPEEIVTFTDKTESKNLKASINWNNEYISGDESNLSLVNDIGTETPVATLEIKNGENTVKSVELFSPEPINLPTISDSLFKNVWLIIFGLVLLLIIWRLIYVHNRRKILKRQRMRKLRRQRAYQMNMSQNRPRRRVKVKRKRARI